MNYKRIYDSLMLKAKRENIKSGEVYEIHHITPKCMGGSDYNDNLVKLTPEQHYTAHLLLAKIYDIPELWCAVNLMAGNGKSPYNKRTPNRSNNKRYGFIRRRHAEALSDLIKDSYARKNGFQNYLHQCESIWHDFIFKRENSTTISQKYSIAKANVERSLKFYAAAMQYEHILTQVRKDNRSKTSKKIRNAFTKEQENRRIQAVRNYDTTERDAKMSKDRKGSGNPMYGKRFKHEIVKCPNCNKSGGISSMKRWHFDNCKERNEN